MQLANGNEYNPECWNDFETVIRSGVKRVILFGPSGTGKTMGGLTVGVQPETGAFRLECTEDMSTFDIVGGWKPARDEWEYLDAAPIMAWIGNGYAGGRLVVDEIDKASGDVLGNLLAMTDSDASCSWKHPVKGVLKPNPGYSVVMTTNIPDPDGLEPALKDRFPVAIYIDQPHPAGVAALPAKFQEKAIATCMTYSLRKWADVATLERTVGIAEALRLVIGKEAAIQMADDFMVDGVA